MTAVLEGTTNARSPGNHGVARALRKGLSIMKKNDVAIPLPCTVDWRKMSPAEGGRFCGDCKKVVRDLSTMRERDARTLLGSAGNGELCVRYVYDKHGKVFFAGDGAPALVPASFLQRAKRVALSAAAIAVPLSLAACSPSAGATADDHEKQEQELYEMMGAPERPLTDATPGETPDAGDAGPQDDGGDAGPQDDGGDAGPQDDGGDAATEAGEPETPI
jgi:hypothetical protein